MFTLNNNLLSLLRKTKTHYVELLFIIIFTSVYYTLLQKRKKQDQKEPAVYKTPNLYHYSCSLNIVLVCLWSLYTTVSLQHSHFDYHRTLNRRSTLYFPQFTNNITIIIKGDKL